MQNRFCFPFVATFVLMSPVMADDGLPPGIPQAVIAQASSATEIDISWSASSDPDGVAKYNIYRNGQFTNATADIEFRDSNVSPNSNYHYWVTAVDTTGRESSTSKWIYTQTPATQKYSTITPQSRPGAPINVTATLQSDGGVSLTWSPGDNSQQVSGYNVYRNQQYINTTNESHYTDYGSALNDGVEYSIVSFTAGEQYSIHSASASIANGTVAPPPLESITADKPSIATGLHSSVHSDSSVSLFWNQVDTAEGYNVYRDNAYIATVYNESFTDQGLAANQNYHYSVVTFTADKQFSEHSANHGVTTNPGESARIQTFDDSSARSATALAAIDGEYYLAFSDEFNSNGLDLAKWNTAYLWGPDVTTNNEEQYYVDIARNPDFGYQPFSANGNYLSIKADRTPDWLKNSANGKPYLSGLITSYDSFQFTYGYAEARLRAPSGNGFFSAFWLLNTHYVDLEPEIDITELLGESPYVVHHTYHHRDENYNLVSTDTFDTYVDDFSRDFHTYAVRWSPGEIVWYVDGVETRRFTEGAIAAQPMYVLFNLAIDGNWPQSPDDNTVFPSALEIDYVRVYRK